MKESIKLSAAIGLLVIGLGVSIGLLVHKYNHQNPKIKPKKDLTNFSNPNFKEGDCFLVSEPNSALSPHYLKIFEKDVDKEKYSVLEVIGNGKNKDVVIYINYYDELKSFEKYRSKCPEFIVK